jgi:hypothetical protein
MGEIVFLLAGIPLGLALSNVTEWVVHKYVLHGLGRRRQSFWSFHWHEHHNACRRNRMHDPDYHRPALGWHAQGKEILGLAAGAIPSSFLFPWWPTLSATLVWAAFDYYRKHKRAHLDPEWARRHLVWHYDHHMGPDQNANWCVTRPWFDLLVGTRKPFGGTPLEAERIARTAAPSGALSAQTSSRSGARSLAREA